MGEDALTVNGRLEGQLCSKAQNWTSCSWQLAFDFTSSFQSWKREKKEIFNLKIN